MGIELFDSEGQIRSLYDILRDLSKQWDNLDTNTKDYIALEQAGANQTQNFMALMNNFGTAVSATATAYDSLGSAVKENEAVINSLQGKTAQLRATFQDFANDVLSREMLGTLLELANGLLKIGDAIPNIVTQSILLAGVLGPMGALLSKFYLGPVLGISTNLGLIGIALGVVVPLALQLFNAWKDAHPTFEEATNQIQSLNDQLGKNQTRLEEINKIPWYERTTEINNEKAALELENEELRDQIEYYKQLRAEKAQKTAGAAQDVYTGQVSEYRVYSKQAEEGAGAFTSFTNLEDAQAYAEAMGEGFGHIEEVMEVVTLKGDELDKYLTENLTHINDAMIANGEVSEDLINWWQRNGDVVKEQYQAYKDLEAAGYTLTDEQQALIRQYELFVNTGAEATEQTKFLAENVLVSQDAVSKLTKQYPELSSAISNNNGQLGINIEKLGSISYSSLKAKQAIYDLALQMINANANQLDMSSSVAQLQQLALSAGVAGAALNFTEWVDEYEDQTVAWEKYVTYITKKIQQALKDTWKTPSKPPSKDLDKITDSTKKLNDVLKEEEKRLKGIVNALKDKVSAYETLFGYLQDQIDVEIDALEAQKQALQDQNEELQTQVELEEKLDALARAKSQKAMVYKNGRFQYVSDIDETSKAQADLEEYYRNQEYQAQLDAIDAQIEALENQKKQIDLGQEQIKQQQDLAKVVEQLGVDFTNGWRDVFDDLDVYLSGYKTSLADLEKYTDEIEDLQQESIDYSKLWHEAYESGASQQVLDAIHQLEVERRKEAGDTSVYNPTTGTWSSSVKPASSETDSKGRPVSGVGSNQYNYLSNLASTGTAGQKAWAKDQLAKGKYATGTTSARGGFSLVGEKGAELRVLNQGDGILPADITKNLWAWGSLTPTTLVNALGGLGSSKMMSVSIANLNLPEVRDGEGFVNYMKNNFWRSAVQTNFNR